MADAATQSTNQIPTPEELGFDPEALRKKYAAERAKRLRADANDQYQMIAGRFDHYNEDPYVEPGFTRPARHEDIDVLIIGGGFGGQLAAVRLQEVGVVDFRIVEKAGDFGGTWYWNRYPGAQCDIEGYLYLPLLEETQHIPKERYSFAPEIFAHPGASASSSTSTSGHASRRGSGRLVGMTRPAAGSSPPIGTTSSGRGSSSCRAGR